MSHFLLGAQRVLNRVSIRLATKAFANVIKRLRQNAAIGGLCLLPALAAGADSGRWEERLQQAGVADMLSALDTQISRDVLSLHRTDFGLNEDDLLIMAAQLHDLLGSHALRSRLQQHLRATFSAAELQELDAVLGSWRFTTYSSYHNPLEVAARQRALRLYERRLQRQQPSAGRLALLSQLDDQLGQSELEAAIQVGLRKQLLSVITTLQTQAVATEAELAQQTQQYAEQVSAALSEQAVQHSLYFLRQIPNGELQRWSSRLQAPVYGRFMAACAEALQAAFVDARTTLSQSSDLQLISSR